MNIYYTDTFELPLPEGHRFPIDKYRLLRLALLERGVVARTRLLQALPAQAELVMTAHDPAYVRAVLDGSLDRRMQRRIGLPWSPGFVTRTLASVGATIEASRSAVHHGFGAALSGGTHHAFRDFGEGYCVFNDVAVAIAVLRREGRARRPAVVDLDVHQGNGTAAMLENDGEAYTLSMHGAGNFPFRKYPSTRDVDLPDGCGDADYLDALAPELERVAAFGPDIIYYQAGVDVIAEDALGRLSLSIEGVARRDRMVGELAQRLGVPLVMTMGGGYARPITHTVEAHCASHVVMQRLYG